MSVSGKGRIRKGLLLPPFTVFGVLQYPGREAKQCSALKHTLQSQAASTCIFTPLFNVFSLHYLTSFVASGKLLTLLISGLIRRKATPDTQDWPGAVSAGLVLLGARLALTAGARRAPLSMNRLAEHQHQERQRVEWWLWGVGEGRRIGEMLFKGRNLELVDR